MEAGKPRDFQVALLVTHTLSLHKQKCLDPISSGPNTFFWIISMAVQTQPGAEKNLIQDFSCHSNSKLS